MKASINPPIKYSRDFNITRFQFKHLSSDIGIAFVAYLNSIFDIEGKFTWRYYTKEIECKLGEEVWENYWLDHSQDLSVDLNINFISFSNLPPKEEKVVHINKKLFGSITITGLPTVEFT